MLLLLLINIIKEALWSVLMLCTPVFIFTSGSSLLVGRPRCGLFIWLSLLVIFYIFLSFCHLFHEKTDETRHFRMIRKWPPTITNCTKHFYWGSLYINLYIESLKKHKAILICHLFITWYEDLWASRVYQHLQIIIIIHYYYYYYYYYYSNLTQNRKN